MVRGLHRPSMNEVTRTLAHRSAYLVNKLQPQIDEQGWGQAIRSSGFFRELLALALLVEMIDAGLSKQTINRVTELEHHMRDCCNKCRSFLEELDAE